MRTDDLILRFFRDDIGGILVNDADGNVLYEDDVTAFVRLEKTNWHAACPPPRGDQCAEVWDLLRAENRKTYLVITSTRTADGRTVQIHHLVDTSLYTELNRGISDYSRSLRNEKDHDALTGLYNRSKFLELRRTLFRKQDSIAVFNLDVNNLKHTNDVFGHEAGDRMIRKAAQSLKAIETRNVMPFRVGGDEFIVVACHVSEEEAEEIRRNREKALEELNRGQEGEPCEMACGFVYRTGGFDLDEVLALADQRMYEDKKRMKQAREK